MYNFVDRYYAEGRTSRDSISLKLFGSLEKGICILTARQFRFEPVLETSRDTHQDIISSQLANRTIG